MRVRAASSATRRATQRPPLIPILDIPPSAAPTPPRTPTLRFVASRARTDSIPRMTRRYCATAACLLLATFRAPLHRFAARRSAAHPPIEAHKRPRARATRSRAGPPARPRLGRPPHHRATPRSSRVTKGSSHAHPTRSLLSRARPTLLSPRTPPPPPPPPPPPCANDAVADSSPKNFRSFFFS